MLPVRLIDYGLRDYGTAEWVGGDAECEHNPQRPDGGDRSDRSLPLGRGGVYREVCGKCGAIRVDNQIGLEPTPDEYVAGMVQVFREVWRVLRDDGTAWLNLGDTYSAQRWTNDSPQKMNKYKDTHRGIAPEKHSGLPDKNLIGIPWRVAFALQADGWYLRQDIIWHKPNPMPESVKDRCTKAHEYIFLLTKNARYWYDHEAVKEESERPDLVGRAKRNVYAPKWNGEGGREFERRAGVEYCSPNGRNRRSVWTVTTKPYSGAHYAVFPPDLIEPCILAGCPPGGIVLDPFIGSGTTAMVARKHGRHAIGLDLNFEYLTTNARERLQYGSYVPVADGITQLTIGGE